MRQKIEGIVHVYPVKDVIKHETNMGAAGCYCEPEIKEVVIDSRQDNRVVRCVIIHQKLKKGERYAERKMPAL